MDDDTTETKTSMFNTPISELTLKDHLKINGVTALVIGGVTAVWAGGTYLRELRRQRKLNKRIEALEEPIRENLNR